MIFLHGVNSAGIELRPFVDAMRPFAAVRTPDLAGHGGRALAEHPSTRELADDVIAWMDHEGIARDVVGGYSYGGTLALYLARHYPERVSGVVTLAAKHIFDETTVQHWRHLVTTERISRLLLPGGVRRVEELARIHAPNTWEDVLAMNRRLVETFADQPPLSTADLSAIRAPVMVVSSNLDQIVPWPETMALARALQDVHVAMFYGPAHPMAAIPLSPIARNIHEWMVKRQLA
jgi:pimeloyl-ACP methyl ester carboxylesterase